MLPVRPITQREGVSPRHLLQLHRSQGSEPDIAKKPGGHRVTIDHLLGDGAAYFGVSPEERDSRPPPRTQIKKWLYPLNVLCPFFSNKKNSCGYS
ncbi:MAG: hypothetical protein ACREBC_38975 [Pyrinomonadaceae bacterium]